MTATNRLPLRMQIVWDVLEVAKELDVADVVAACRTLIHLHRVGKWDRNAFATVIDADREFEEMRAEYESEDA